MRGCRIAIACVAALLAVSVQWSVVPSAGSQSLRDVVFVANAEDGTVSVIDAASFEVIRTLDIVPDGATAPPDQDPVHAATTPIVNEGAGVNLAQDLDVSPDGRTLYVARGHRGDVAAFDIASGDMLWRVPMVGVRADHSALSPDGSRLFVSDLTVSLVHAIDTATATVVGSFQTGEWSHDNVFSANGERLYNGSIGNVLTPREARQNRPGPLHPYVLTIADPDTLEVERRLAFPDGIRPFVISDDETRMFAQLSELHGLVEVDLASGDILRTAQLPIDEGVTEDDYDFEAPHHGLDMSGDGTLLCAAGRASDYVALVSTDTLEAEAIIEVDDAPGDAHTGPDGTHCFVANTRADTVSVISYETKTEVARIAAGDGPKHIEPARIPAS